MRDNVIRFNVLILTIISYFASIIYVNIYIINFDF